MAGKKRPFSLEHLIGDALEAVGAAAEQRVGDDVSRFIANDIFYISMLLLSGLLLIANAQLQNTVLVGAILNLYLLALVLTMSSYAYLRLARRKRYSPEENKAIAVSSRLILCIAGGLMVFLIAAMYLFSTFGHIGGRLADYPISVIMGFGAIAGVAFFFRIVYPVEKNGGIGKALPEITDGIAWILAIGGIGALAMADIAYTLLLILKFVGMPIY